MQINSIVNNTTNYSNMDSSRVRSDNGNSFFDSLQEKHSTVSINMSSAYNFNADAAVTLNISPAYVEKAENNPEISSNIERLSGLAESFPQYLGTHNTLPDGTKVTGVSFVVDENGGVSCSCTYEKSAESSDGAVESIWDKVAARIRERRAAAKEQAESNDDTQESAEAKSRQQKNFNEYFSGSAINYLS